MEGRRPMDFLQPRNRNTTGGTGCRDRSIVRIRFWIRWGSSTILFLSLRLLCSRNKSNAEVEFKVDFFEFHALLERYITLCLSIMGVVVSAGYGNGIGPNVNALRYLVNPDLNRTRPISNHRFHANLLDALD